MYAMITRVIIDIVDAYITYGIESSFDKSQCVVNLPQDGILMNLTYLYTLLVPLSIG